VIPHTQLLISLSIAVAARSTIVLGCPALFISSKSEPEVLHNLCVCVCVLQS